MVIGSVIDTADSTNWAHTLFAANIGAQTNADFLSRQHGGP
jgi:hypothetical protein